MHVKALVQQPQSTNQAAPEPIFVGPDAGTGGLADTIIISALQSVQPVRHRPGCRQQPRWWSRAVPSKSARASSTQDVDTWYFNLGLEGTFGFSDRGFDWDVNYVHSENKADADVSRTATTSPKSSSRSAIRRSARWCPGCTPLDLFGGQGRPITQEMIDYIRTTQIDSSQADRWTLFSANVTGDLFDIGDRAAGFAAGVEHRKYEGEFHPGSAAPDRRIAGLVRRAGVGRATTSTRSTPSSTSRCSSRLDVSAAVRYSDYSTFGSETTGKVGLRWQPIEALAFRGTYSKGFRAPNLGELFGLTQFAATLTDPCGPTGVAGRDRRRRSEHHAAGNRLPRAGRAVGLRAGQHADHHVHRRQSRPASPKTRTATPWASCTTPRWAEGLRRSH